MIEKTITVDYGTHAYEERWEPTDIFCPSCGLKTIWHRIDGEDYYIGEEHLCLTCDASFYLPSLVKSPAYEPDKQRLAALKT